MDGSKICETAVMAAPIPLLLSWLPSPTYPVLHPHPTNPLRPLSEIATPFARDFPLTLSLTTPSANEIPSSLTQNAYSTPRPPLNQGAMSSWSSVVSSPFRPNRLSSSYNEIAHSIQFQAQKILRPYSTPKD